MGHEPSQHEFLLWTEPQTEAISLCGSLDYQTKSRDTIFRSRAIQWEDLMISRKDQTILLEDHVGS